jgi:hypothetical protein
MKQCMIKYFNDKVIDKALQANEKCQETWDDYMFHIINLTNPNRNLDALAALQEIWNVIDLRNISVDCNLPKMHC